MFDFDLIIFTFHTSTTHMLGIVTATPFLRCHRKKMFPQITPTIQQRWKEYFEKLSWWRLFNLFGSSCVKVWHLQLKGGHSKNSPLMYISKQFCSWQRKKRIPFSSSFFMKKPTNQTLLILFWGFLFQRWSLDNIAGKMGWKYKSFQPPAHCETIKIQ